MNVDLYEPGFVKVWLQLDCDLGFIGAADECIGETPIWLDDEVHMCGWESILGVDKGDVLNWSLENGIVPHQPFLVSLKPHWSRAWCDYGYEWDVDFHAEVLYVEPMDFNRAADVLDAWLKAEVCQDCKECWGIA